MNDQTLKVYDTSGEWFINSGSFPFTDPDSGARYEPGVPTQAKRTKWVEMQDCIKDHKPPVKEPAKPAK